MIPSIPPKISEKKNVDGAEVNQQRHLVEESGLWLENVERTHLALASGKPLLQKDKVLIPFQAFSATALSCWR